MLFLSEARRVTRGLHSGCIGSSPERDVGSYSIESVCGLCGCQECVCPTVTSRCSSADSCQREVTMTGSNEKSAREIGVSFIPDSRSYFSVGQNRNKY